MTKQIVCKRCGCETFKAQDVDSCEECIHNGWLSENSDDDEWKIQLYFEESGAFDEKDNEYQYDISIPKNLIRCQVEIEERCELGDAFGDGCYLLECTACGEFYHIPK